MNKRKRVKREDIEQILPLNPPSFPSDPDEKMFYITAPDTGEQIGEPFSYNDFLDRIGSMAGISENLLGANRRKKDG
jgi:hypothetical protein